MKVIFILSMLLIIGCTSPKMILQSSNKLEGEYVLNSDKLFQAFSDMNYNSLVINADNTYILKKAEIKFTPVIEQCDIASKGKWSILSNEVLEITSEEKYEKQKGFEYELKKENKYSQDSLYINVKFPNDFHPVKLNFYFNNNNNKSIHTENTVIKLLKSKYLSLKSSYSVNKNHITFSLDANISGNSLYGGRILFNIFEEDIDTEKTNYLTITLPNFDQCFYEFEPYNQEIIFIKNPKELLWKGYVWNKL